MKKYKFTTFLIILSLCFAITGCFGRRQESILTECKSNMKNIGIACEMYAADNEGHYPKSLNDLSNGNSPYLRVIPKCPIDDCEYKYLSKIVKSNDGKDIDYYIVYCEKHNCIYDAITGLLIDNPSLQPAEGSLKEVFNNIKNGKITENIILTDEEMKQLGFK